MCEPPCPMLSTMSPRAPVSVLFESVQFSVPPLATSTWMLSPPLVLLSLSRPIEQLSMVSRLSVPLLLMR